MWSPVESGGAEAEGGPRAAPCARAKHAAALLGAHVYVLAGRGAGGAVPLRDFWRYSLAEGRWERLGCAGEVPPALQEHTMTAHGSRLYVFGGEPGALGTETPLWVFDTEIQMWRKLAGQPTAQKFGAGTLRRRTGGRDTRACAGGPRGRRGHSAHALRDCLLIYGGYRDLRGSTNELWAFHYETETWQAVRTAGAGPARHRHAAALHGARLYVHGGRQDLRACADLWHYDTLSRVWTQVRTPARVSPGARCGHAGLRAGAHFYIFGGEVDGHPTNELWRFHFATETWERIVQSVKWPASRVDSCALLVPGGVRALRAGGERGEGAGRGGTSARPAAQPGLLREISKLSSFHIRRAARCSYSVLAAERDSTESLVRHDTALGKSHSAYVIDERQPGDGGESPREADDAEPYGDIAREPISVPDFADMVLPTPVLSPVEATKLVYLDSEEEEEMRRQATPARRRATGAGEDGGARAIVMPKSASVRFTRDAVTVTTEEDEGELSTSDYASAERVNRLSGASSLGFSNPHYMGPDVRALGAALTPDSGVAPADIELRDMRARPRPPPRAADAALHVLLVGGKEPPHVALLQSPLSMWSYRLL